MRVAVPHTLPRAELRRRVQARSGEIAEHIPLPGAQVATDWPSEDRMAMTIRALGQTVSGHVDIEDHELVFTVALPPALGFIEPMIAAGLQQKGTRLVRHDPDGGGG